MGQRRNRRRTRLRSRNRNIIPIDPPSPPESFCSSTASTSPEPDNFPQCHGRSFEPIPPYPAPIWHHGYVNWERHERIVKLDLEAEQCRVFGGEPGDDVDLCYRMLEYFGALDYIDSAPKLPG